MTPETRQVWKDAAKAAPILLKGMANVALFTCTMFAAFTGDWPMLAAFLLLDITLNDKLGTKLTVNVIGKNAEGEPNDPS